MFHGRFHWSMRFACRMGSVADMAGCLDIGDFHVSAIAGLYDWWMPCLFVRAVIDPPFLGVSAFEQTLRT
jgi:hypothetical protein